MMTVLWVISSKQWDEHYKLQVFVILSRKKNLFFWVDSEQIHTCSLWYSCSDRQYTIDVSTTILRQNSSSFPLHGR